MKNPEPLTEKEQQIQGAILDELARNKANAQEITNICADLIARNIAVLYGEYATDAYEQVINDILEKASVYQGFDFYNTQIEFISREEWEKGKK